MEAQMSCSVPPGASRISLPPQMLSLTPMGKGGRGEGGGRRSGDESCSHLIEKCTSASLQLLNCPLIVPRCSTHAGDLPLMCSDWWLIPMLEDMFECFIGTENLFAHADSLARVSPQETSAGTTEVSGPLVGRED